MRRGLTAFILALLMQALAGCVSVDVGKEPVAQVLLSLRDGTSRPATRRSEPLIEALLIQPQPANAFADTLSIAYSRREYEFAFYQFASWTERPVRQLPILLQRRLEARGVAGAVGLVGDPLRADWSLGVGIDTLHHDVSVAPGSARLAVTVDLFNRRTRARALRSAASRPARPRRAPIRRQRRRRCRLLQRMCSTNCCRGSKPSCSGPRRRCVERVRASAWATLSSRHRTLSVRVRADCRGPRAARAPSAARGAPMGRRR